MRGTYLRGLTTAQSTEGHRLPHLDSSLSESQEGLTHLASPLLVQVPSTMSQTLEPFHIDTTLLFLVDPPQRI